MKQVFFLTKRTNCHLKKFLISWVSELLINILNLTSFASILIYICMFGSGSVFRLRIRIQEAPEYGSNTDPDPDLQHCYTILYTYIKYTSGSLLKKVRLWTAVEANHASEKAAEIINKIVYTYIWVYTVCKRWH